MKTTGTLALLISMLGTSVYAADATGTWLNDDKDAIVQIADCAATIALPGTPPRGTPQQPPAPPSGLLCGTVVWLKNPVDPATGGPQTDKKNQDPAQRGRQILGMQGISNMRPTTPAGKWDGRVYDIDGGKTYDGNLILRGENELRVQGCVLLLCQGETWTRTSLPAPPVPPAGAAPARPSAPGQQPQRAR